MEQSDLVVFENADYSVDKSPVVEEDKVFFLPKSRIRNFNLQFYRERTMDVGRQAVHRYQTLQQHYKKSEGDSKHTFGAIPGRCILYRRSLISSRSVKCAPLGYSALSSALPAGRGSISISLVAQGCT